MAIGSEEITQWVVRLDHGDQRAAQILREKYLANLVRYARRMLAGLLCRGVDEKDVALSVMNTFCRGMTAHRLEESNDREDSWKLLATFTASKVCAQKRRHYVDKRGDRAVRGESVSLRVDDGKDHDRGIGQVLGKEPTSELANMVVENCRPMLDSLRDGTLRQVALFTFEGYATQEIAGKLGCIRRSVERKLERVREKWSREKEPLS